MLLGPHQRRSVGPEVASGPCAAQGPHRDTKASGTSLWHNPVWQEPQFHPSGRLQTQAMPVASDEFGS